MSQLYLFLLSALRALVEVALLALLGQGVLAFLAGSRRHDNFVFRLLQVITRPALAITRKITPSVIIDKHLPFVAFFLMLWLWFLLAWIKRSLCLSTSLAC
ncbi:MAG: hypothetical protein KF766_02620 [Rhodocyclaceae bacterium]|nr:hypothetical protein [Rhodocyclaceae bacterium]